MGIDGGCIEECCFHVMLQTRRVFNEFPCLWGSWLVPDLWFGFRFKLAEGSVYAWLREFLVKSFIVLA